jgi:GPH family glycoside/pentoside/hexuronide:cation symporter
MTALSVIVATATAMPLVAAFGGGDRQRGFVGLAMLFAALSLACSLNLFAACREAERDHAAPGFAIAPAIVQMLRNRAWQVTFAVAALNFVRFGAVLSLTTYFALHVLHAPWTISLLLPAVSGTLLLGAVLAPPILRRFGMRRGWWGAICVAAAFYALLPFAELHPALFVVLFALASLATSVTMTGIFAMGAAAVDYHETLFGVRHEGLLSSGISLATKFGMAVGTAAVAFTLGLAGYRPDHVGGAATAAIRWSYYGWPLAVLAVQAVAITFWPMTADE